MTEEEYRKLHPHCLRIYETLTGDFMDAVQKDIDNYMMLIMAYGKVHDAMKAAHEELMAKVT